MLSKEIVEELLEYFPETGKFTWKERKPCHFEETNKRTREQSCQRWNTSFSGKEAFITNSLGYKCGTIFNKLYLAHRIAWLIVFGVYPNEQIDHINGNRSDNRIVNLREVSINENLKNSKLSTRNTSGAIGVCWRKHKNKYQVTISDKNKLIHLGMFKDFNEAVLCRKQAELKYGYHPNHGRN